MMSKNIKQIFDGLSRNSGDIYKFDDASPTININRLTGRASTFYEKMRYLVEYKEEHTIRRSAVERILKRKLLLERVEDPSLSLLEELVASGYLSNQMIPESVADEINIIINKYLIFGHEQQISSRKIISLMASEVERFLFPQKLNDLVAGSFYKTIVENIRYQGAMKEKDLLDQVFLATRRSLLEDDYATSLYAFLARMMPDLPKLRDENEIRKNSEIFAQTLFEAEQKIEHPLGWRITNRLKNYSIYFLVIKEIIKKYGKTAESIFVDQGRLEEEVSRMLAIKYEEQYELIDKSGTRAVGYILITKIILAFILELPYERFFLEEVNYLALSTNVVFHPLLLYFMVKAIPPVHPENTQAIVSGVADIVSGRQLRPIYVRPPVQNGFLEIIFESIYFVLFVVSFGFILWALNALDFNFVSILLFLFFLTLVSYFGFRIRFNAKKWRLSTESDDFFGLLWNFFTLPIVRTGRWLSKKFDSVNIFVFVLDFIIETPFKFVLGTLNSFVSYMKDKREDPY